MAQPNILGVFCEDIRDEASGLLSLIGVFQDSASVESEQGFLPKLCLYVRTSFDISYPMPPGMIDLKFSDGESVRVGDIDQAIIDKAIRDTSAQGNKIATVVSRAVLIGLRMSLGRILATGEFAGVVHTIATLNFVLAKSATQSPNALLPPS